MNGFLNRYVNTSSAEKIVEVRNGRYENKLFDISFDIPENWHIIQAEKFDALAREQKFTESMEFLKDSLYNALGHPCLVISKFNPESEDLDGIVSPVINFSIYSKDFEEPNISLRDYALLLDVEEGESIVSKFKLTHVGKVFDKEGYERIILDSEYLFEHPELKNPEMVEMKVLNIDYEDYFLDFSMTQCKNQGQIADIEFTNFMNSIKLKK